MQTSLRYVMYISRRRPEASDEAVASMVKRAQNFNDRLNLTGLLVCGHHWFLQHIEGLREDISRAYDRILASQLHSDITMLGHGLLLGREFPRWTMASLGGNELDDVLADCGLTPQSQNLAQIDTIKLVHVIRHARDQLLQRYELTDNAPIIFVD